MFCPDVGVSRAREGPIQGESIVKRGKTLAADKWLDLQWVAKARCAGFGTMCQGAGWREGVQFLEFVVYRDSQTVLKQRPAHRRERALRP